MKIKLGIEHYYGNGWQIVAYMPYANLSEVELAQDLIRPIMKHFGGDAYPADIPNSPYTHTVMLWALDNCPDNIDGMLEQLNIALSKSFEIGNY